MVAHGAVGRGNEIVIPGKVDWVVDALGVLTLSKDRTIIHEQRRGLQRAGHETRAGFARAPRDQLCQCRART